MDTKTLMLQVAGELLSVDRSCAENDQDIQASKRTASRRSSISASLRRLAEPPVDPNVRRALLTDAKYHDEIADLEGESIERRLKFNARLAECRARFVAVLDDLEESLQHP
jgi:hypothetical protein